MSQTYVVGSRYNVVRTVHYVVASCPPWVPQHDVVRLYVVLLYVVLSKNNVVPTEHYVVGSWRRRVAGDTT